MILGYKWTVVLTRLTPISGSHIGAHFQKHLWETIQHSNRYSHSEQNKRANCDTSKAQAHWHLMWWTHLRHQSWLKLQRKDITHLHQPLIHPCHHGLNARENDPSRHVDLQNTSAKKGESSSVCMQALNSEMPKTSSTSVMLTCFITHDWGCRLMI